MTTDDDTADGPAAADGPVRVGIDVGGTKIAAGVVSQGGALLCRSRAAARPELAPAELAERVVDQVAALLAEAGVAPSRVAFVGVGVPADVDPASGRIKTIPNLPRWVGERPVELFRRAFDTRLGISPPVAVDNDACVAALAEARYGAGRGAARILYLTVSTGVGGARCDGGGTQNLEPGLNLFPDPDQPDVALEFLASGSALARRARREIGARLAAGGDGAVAALTRLFALAEVAGATLAEQVERLTARDLGVAAVAGDAYCRALFAESAALVARGIAELLARGHGEERVVVGGAVAEHAPGYLDQLRRALAELAARGGAPAGLRRLDLDRALVPAALGEERGILGAVLLQP